MSQTQRQAQLLDRILEPVSRCLTPDAARKLLDLRADPELQLRVDELADKANEGRLTQDEQVEYDAYIAAASVIAIMQTKARRLLEPNPAA